MASAPRASTCARLAPPPGTNRPIVWTWPYSGAMHRRVTPVPRAKSSDSTKCLPDPDGPFPGGRVGCRGAAVALATRRLQQQPNAEQLDLVGSTDRDRLEFAASTAAQRRSDLGGDLPDGASAAVFFASA